MAGKTKLNCWDFKKCQRKKDCPAYYERSLNGCNTGKNGGRACWVIEKTLCKGEVQGVFTEKIHKCLDCDFYKQVRKEEGSAYLNSRDLLNTIKSKKNPKK